MDSNVSVLQRAEHLLAEGRWPEAEAILREAVAQDVADEKIALAWCNVLLTYGDVREGRSLLRKIKEAGPAHPMISFCLALGFQADGDFAAARGRLEELRSAHPNWHQATHLLVRMLYLEGKYNEAIEIVDPLLAKEDPLVICAFGLVASRVGRTAEAITRLAALVEDSLVPVGIRHEAGLLLARLLDAEGRYDEALDFGERAHALAPSSYDPKAAEALIEARIGSTSPAGIARLARAGGDTSRPIFILGMPRSGTSLTEAILGEHPHVGPLGECRLIERFVPLDLTAEPLVNQVSEQLLAVYRGIDGNHLRITDKQLGNFLHLDALASLLPQARVIWCRRDRRDVAVSCFFQQFQTGAPWAGNIEHVLHYEQLYTRLMRHWQQVLSLPILEWEYEQLVAQPREQVTRMLDFLGLFWEERCLKFDLSSRTTLTASNQQVKEEIYRSSVGRWRRYPQLFSDSEG